MSNRKRIAPASALSLLASVSAFAQDTPIILEAESGDRGAAFNFVEQGGVQYITISSTIGGGNPTNVARVVTFTVTFPAAGTYELYGRLRVGTANPFNDDSFYYANGFGVQPVSTDGSADSAWILANGLAAPVGHTLPTNKVVGGGVATTGVFKWVKLSAFDGGEPPVAGFVVPADNLTQTFQVAGREDGLDLDKFAFGRQGLFFTVNDLDNGLPGTTVPPPPPFVPPGPPIATGQAKFLGSAFSPAQTTSFTAYWNKVTPENAGKWGSVEAQRDVMSWAQLDTAYNVAQANGFPFHMHVLVWGNQQPAWIETLPPAEQLEEIQEWFQEVAARYPGIDILEVVNEPLHDPPNQAGNGGGNYIAALGGNGATGWDWVLNAFRLARTYFPGTPLMLNDFSITNSTADTARYKEIVALLQAENLIDVVGVQGHAFSTRPNIPMSTHIANLDSLAATGLPIHVTELDVDGPTDEVQLEDYQRIFPVFWEHPAVKGITLWGFRPGHWRTAQGAYLVLENGAERPAMLWLQDYVQDSVPEVAAGQVFNVSEDAAGGTVLGTVVATDADVGTFLDGWRIDGGSGTAAFVIDEATGMLSLANGTALDFETAASYTLSVSVYDGFRRSVSESVSIQVGNVNDNTPVIAAGQSFPIDGANKEQVFGRVLASDADDTNQPAFTVLQRWKIVDGEEAWNFEIDRNTGAIRFKYADFIDFRRTGYSLFVTVSDGVNRSVLTEIRVTIPASVSICHRNQTLSVPKQAVAGHLRHGDCIGRCE